MRTITNWLTLAEAAADATEVARCLDEATILAGTCHDWRTILRALPVLRHVSRERIAETAIRTLEHARAERDVWAFRDVATARATCLDDTSGARAALDECAAAFRAPRTNVLGQTALLLGKLDLARGYEWVLLGHGYLETLGDDQGLCRCLEAGRDMARDQRNADDLCSVATEWAKLVDRAEGVALLTEAEAMASNGSASPWTLANVWHALDDARAVHRVLYGALDRATSCANALHVARAWASHDERDEVRAALAKARAFAASVSEWVEIAEFAFDAKLDEDEVRAPLERAEHRAEDDEQRGLIAGAYSRWLHDERSADRVGPRGVGPEALRRHVRTLSGWDTSASRLFDWLRARMTAEGLERIANADYGMDAAKHHAALTDICTTGLLPRRLPWQPHEVLALSRWSEGDGVDHLARALCCTLLCLSSDGSDELVTNGVILAESCLALGDEAIDLVERFFAWRSETEENGVDADDPGPEHPIALLLLFLVRASHAADDPRLKSLAAMVVEHPCHPLDESAEWIAGSTRAKLWEDLVRRILVPMRDAHAPNVGRLLAALARS
jgi:hypothetical protein